MRPATSVALVGSGFIAVTYGLARFVFGLFLPTVRADMGLSAEAAGVIGALPFASFVLASLAASRVSAALGPRNAAAGTSVLAAVGLWTVGHATEPVSLALGVLICGISTGLALPVMAQAVHLGVPRGLRGRVNATVNAGTSVGVAVAALAVIWWADAWRSTYEVFALLAGLTVVATFLRLPGKRNPNARFRNRAHGGHATRSQWVRIGRLGALAGVMGFVSALYWVFAPDFVVNGGGLSPGQSAWLWLAVGVGGLSGSFAGDLIDRYGSAISHAFALAVLAASLTLLAADPGHLPLPMISAAAFGAAYMTLTGLYLVEGTRIMADRPAFGPVVPATAIAAGQMLGSPIAGWLIVSTTYGTAFGIFASVGLTVAVLSLWLTAAAPSASVSLATGED